MVVRAPGEVTAKTPAIHRQGSAVGKGEPRQYRAVVMYDVLNMRLYTLRKINWSLYTLYIDNIYRGRERGGGMMYGYCMLLYAYLI